MKIIVHGDSNKTFFELDDIREIYYADKKHNNAIDADRSLLCELTGLFYVVKNCDDDVIGLEQYRRYFYDSDKKECLGKDKINEILKTHDVICGFNGYEKTDFIFSWPFERGFHKCFIIYLQVIKDLYGEAMYKHYCCFLLGHWHTHGNLIIGKRKVLADYLDFCLKTFNELKKRTNIPNRGMEYISEFLMGAWLTYNNFKIYFNDWKVHNTGIIVKGGQNVSEL